MALTMPQRSCNAFALCTVHAMPPCLGTTSSARNGAACGRPATQKWTLETRPRMAQTVPGAANRGRCGFGSFRVLGWLGTLSKLLASFYVTCLLLARFCLMSDVWFILFASFAFHLPASLWIHHLGPILGLCACGFKLLGKDFLYQRLSFHINDLPSQSCRSWRFWRRNPSLWQPHLCNLAKAVSSFKRRFAPSSADWENDNMIEGYWRRLYVCDLCCFILFLRFEHFVILDHSFVLF